MANANAPFGLRPVRNLRTGTSQVNIATYFVPASDSTALYMGDVVKLGGTADARGSHATVTRAAAGDTVLLGAVVGIDQVKDVSAINLRQNYRPASTAMYVLVCDDPDAVYHVQEDSVGGALAITNVGECADIVVAAGSTVTGKSGTMLDSSTSSSSTANLRILGLADKPDNVIGNYAVFEVIINEHVFKGTAGV